MATANGSAVVVGVLGASALVAAALEVYRIWAAERLGLEYVAELRATLFSRILHASPQALSQQRQGGLLLPFVGDLSAIKKWVSEGLVRVIAASATFALLLSLLALQSLTLAGAVSVIVLVAAGAVITLSGPMNEAIRDLRARRGAVASFVGGSIHVAQTIQAFDRFKREAARLEKRTLALRRAGLRLAVYSGSMAAIVHLAAAALIASTLMIGVVEVSRGRMSVGLVAAAVSLVGLLAAAIRDLGIAYETWRRARVSFDKIGRTLAIAPSLTAGPTVGKERRAQAGLALQSIALRGLFRNVVATARRGEVVNIEGASGTGKSSLLAVCARLRDPDAGCVRLNGRDLRDISIASLRRRVGVASVRVPLMRGSIAMNLRYRAPHATDDDVAEVQRLCGLTQVLQRLPRGDQTRLTEGAPELSVGDGQRLLIARAMLGSPALLILDSVDSHLDAETSRRIADALTGYDGIVLMAAVRPEMRDVADVVWRMADEGLLVEVQPERQAGALVGPNTRIIEQRSTP